MKFNINITEHEAKDGLGAPPISGTYLLCVTEWKDFEADSGSQGVNVTMRIIGTDDPDTKKYHGSFARPTFWCTEKGIGFLRGWLDTVKVGYTANSMNDAETIGKVFWGRIKATTDEQGYDKQDLIRWEAASEEMLSYAAQYVAEWTGEDKPPVNIGSGVSTKKNGTTTKKPNPSPTPGDGGEQIDDDLPF